MVVAECPVGHFSYDGHEPCRPCPRGFFQSTTGEKTCEPCSAKTTAEEGSDNTDKCTEKGEYFIVIVIAICKKFVCLIGS